MTEIIIPSHFHGDRRRPESPQDNTDRTFAGRAGPHNPVAPRPYFEPGHQAFLECPECGSTSFMIVAATDRPYAQFLCSNYARCHGVWKPVELHKPQMTGTTARDMGMVKPSELDRYGRVDAPETEATEGLEFDVEVPGD